MGVLCHLNYISEVSGNLTQQQHILGGFGYTNEDQSKMITAKKWHEATISTSASNFIQLRL